MIMSPELLVTACVFALRVLCAPVGIYTCPDGCQTCCRDESGNPYCCETEPRQKRESISRGTIIIIAVGLSVILVAVVLLIYCNCRQGNFDENPSSEASSEAQYDWFGTVKKDSTSTEHSPPADEQTSKAEDPSSEAQYDAFDIIKKEGATVEQTPTAVTAEDPSSEAQYDAFDIVKKEGASTEQTPPAVDQTFTAAISCMTVRQSGSSPGHNVIKGS